MAVGAIFAYILVRCDLLNMAVWKDLHNTEFAGLVEFLLQLIPAL